MKSVSTQKMKRLDEIAIKRYGIPSLILMENAGRGIAELAQKIVPNNRKKILVVCGKGNNGGDGFVAARHLTNHGYLVKVVILGNPADLKNDPKLNYKILKKMKVSIETISTRQKLIKLKTLAQTSGLIIDGIFGIGLTRPVTGFFYEVILILNGSQKQILAIDVPSGLNSDTGIPMGIAVRAKVTGTLGVAKRGLFLREGLKHSGKVTVLDISLPRQLLA